MRYELSDSEWSVIDAMLPNKPRGVPRVDDRRVLDRAHPGGTCRLSMVLAPLATIVSSAGVEQAFGKAS